MSANKIVNTTPYELSYTFAAFKQLENLDKTARTLIAVYMTNKIDGCADPRAYGGPLHGNLRGSWKYTIGSYRTICDINDTTHIVKVVKVASRGEAYKR